MQPGENPEGADFDRSGWRDLQAQEIGIVLGRNIDRPNHASGSDQAGTALFPTNASQDALLWSELAMLRNGDDRNELGLRLNVALAASVQIDVIGWM